MWIGADCVDGVQTGGMGWDGMGLHRGSKWASTAHGGLEWHSWTGRMSFLARRANLFRKNSSNVISPERSASISWKTRLRSEEGGCSAKSCGAQKRS